MVMRDAMGQMLDELMAADERVCVLDADLAVANGTFKLRNKYPDRAFDVGIAEQNMASVAAGLSAYGLIPYITTFTPFATRRICDQIAVSCAYAKQNVKIIGTDPGIMAEINGGTHMSMEDIGVVRSIPEVVIFEPSDEIELRKAIPQINDYYGTVYMRTPRKYDAPVLHNEGYEFNLFKADILKEGTDITILAMGLLVSESLKAAEELSKNGISAEVINVHTVKPLDCETVINSVRKTKAVVTAENHSIIGGLRSAVAECLMENYPVPMRSVGVQDRFGQVGKLSELMKEYSMTSSDIVSKVKECLELKYTA